MLHGSSFIINVPKKLKILDFTNFPLLKEDNLEFLHEIFKVHLSSSFDIQELKTLFITHILQGMEIFLQIKL